MLMIQLKEYFKIDIHIIYNFILYEQLQESSGNI